VTLFFFRLTFMPITWPPQRNGRSPKVSILHVCDYITKQFIDAVSTPEIKLSMAETWRSCWNDQQGEEQTYWNDRALKPFPLGWKTPAFEISDTVQMIHCTMPRAFLVMNWEDEDLSGLLYQNLLQTQRKSARIETRYWQLSCYVYTLCYRRRLWYYRFDATSKVQSIGELSVHTWLGFIMPSSIAIRTYVTPVTLRTLKGALASETPRTRGSGVQIPHRTCYSIRCFFYSYVIVRRHRHFAICPRYVLEEVLLSA
jgi:hypothetical protein